ncbi:MAG: hypothetical protein FJX74_04125 [Armatimonadetes bacterium]|nr:hypothetical protein [Armatimonadota bacterium]
MSILGYSFSPTEVLLFSVAAGVAVATGSLLINMVWDAFKHVTGRGRGIRRCAACMEPAEPGSYLCYKHARISAVVRGRRADDV